MKFVFVKLKYSGREYEYKTNLPLEKGHVYKIETSGKALPMRVKVVSISDTQTGAYSVSEIIKATEVEDFE